MANLLLLRTIFSYLDEFLDMNINFDLWDHIFVNISWPFPINFSFIPKELVIDQIETILIPLVHNWYPLDTKYLIKYQRGNLASCVNQYKNISPKLFIIFKK